MYFNQDSMNYNPSLVCNESNFSPLQQRLFEHTMEAEIDVVKDAAKKFNRDEISLQTYDKKQMMKEYYRELRKAQYEEVLVENGIVQIITRNLCNAAVPMKVTNFQQPVLEILKRIEDEFDTAYRIKFVVGECFQTIYLDWEKAESGSYLLRKFASAGAIFKADSLARKKEYAHLLLVYLLNQKPSIHWIADNEGWFEFPDEGWKYVEKGAVTWKKVCKMSR